MPVHVVDATESVRAIGGGAVLVAVLAGGDKRAPHIDIKTARRVAAEWEHGS